MARKGLENIDVRIAIAVGILKCITMFFLNACVIVL